MTVRSVGVVSLEPWDHVWRRNQFLVHELLAQQLVERVVFVNPPRPGRADVVVTVRPGLDVVSPALRLPKRAGGLLAAGVGLRRGLLRHLDALWVNDPTLGAHCLRSDQPSVYDVTDDWRWVNTPYYIYRRTVRAEDRLARRATTIVCSEVLRQRWQLRYGVEAAVVHNGIDAGRWSSAEERALPGAAPRVGYVGSLHDQRLDVDLLLAVADDPRTGSVHLVGPDFLGADNRARLRAHPKVHLHGSVPPAEVPSWTCSFDVLTCPHLVTPFTLSLDAIKSYEYLASGRPVVATPSSGFQVLVHDRLTVTGSEGFVEAVARASSTPRSTTPVDGFSWADRARQFAAAAGWT